METDSPTNTNVTMDTTMETLVRALQNIENSDLPDMDGDDVYLHENDHALVSVVKSLATDICISSQGEPLFHTIDQLQQEYGYCIFPGERDRFGWVTACLQTKKGIIVFG